MSTSKEPRLTFDSVSRANETLAVEIRAFAATHAIVDHNDSSREALRPLVRTLYAAICRLAAYRGSPSAPDTKILSAWHSFLDGPIAALAALHHYGPLLAARMLLYLTYAFIRAHQLPQNLPATPASLRPVALRCHLLVALLRQLQALWARSRGRETFAWVFTDYPVSPIHRCDNCCPDELKRGAHPTDENPGSAAPAVDWAAWSARKEEKRLRAACLVAPDELTPANGVRPVRVWRRPEGDTTHHPLDPDATSWQHDSWRVADGDHHTGTAWRRLLVYQRIGSEGPIREDYGYHLVDPDNTRSGTTDWRRRPALRRARQFVLDTQKVRVLHARRPLAAAALTTRLPAELVAQVGRYAEPVPEEPYLDRLDLCAAYQQFPTPACLLQPGGSGKKTKKIKCDQCAHTYASNTVAVKTARRTCPLKSTVVWNLPLRAFHTLHQTTTTWRMCRHFPCTGHHHQHDWVLPARDLEAHLVQVLRAAARDTTGTLTLQAAGLGPHNPLELPTAHEDEARKRRLWDRHHDDDDDAVAEAQWVGLDGLLGVMRHDRTLLGRHPSGSTTTEPSWMFGRTRQDEARVRSVFRDE